MKRIVCIFSTVLLLLGCNREMEDLEFFDEMKTKKKEEEVKIMVFKERSNSYTVNETTKEITYDYVYGTDISSLIPSIEVSSGASVFPPSGQPQDFTSGVDYVVTSADKSVTTKYKVVVRLTKNREANILGFQEGQNVYIVDEEKGQIRFVYPYFTDISSLTPTIDVSVGATVFPASGESQDFTKPLTYIVISEDRNNMKKYNVEISLEKNSEAKILGFKERSNSYSVNETTKEITFKYPYKTDVSSLIPLVEVSAGATVFPASGEVQDFTKEIEYIVTAEDGTEQVYRVVAEVESSLKRTADGIIILNDPDILVGDKILFEGKEYTVADESILKEMIRKQEFDKLPYMVTTKVTNMMRLFEKQGRFNEDISSWDVSNVEDMSMMFYGAIRFKQDLSSWNVSKVKNMDLMFFGANNFESDLSKWDVSSVTSMQWTFYGTYSFDSNLSDWDVSKVTNMARMFSSALVFNGDISTWDVSKVTNMQSMFYRANLFDVDLSKWDVRNVTDMNYMFYDASNFNQNISKWKPKKVTNVSNMFNKATAFDQDISNWCSNMALTGYRVTNFSKGSKIDGKTEKLPDWGTVCP